MRSEADNTQQACVRSITLAENKRKIIEKSKIKENVFTRTEFLITAVATVGVSIAVTSNVNTSAVLARPFMVWMACYTQLFWQKKMRPK